jgi:hypothetical protein
MRSRHFPRMHPRTQEDCGLVESDGSRIRVLMREHDSFLMVSHHRFMVILPHFILPCNCKQIHPPFLQTQHYILSMHIDLLVVSKLSLQLLSLLQALLVCKWICECKVDCIRRRASREGVRECDAKAISIGLPKQIYSFNYVYIERYIPWDALVVLHLPLYLVDRLQSQSKQFTLVIHLPDCHDYSLILLYTSHSVMKPCPILSILFKWE